MSIADIILSIIIWIFQKMILPVLPVNLPLLSFNTFQNILNSSIKHNLIWAFAGFGELFNLKLLFILIVSIIFAEILFWLVRVGIFIVKLIRG
jgi:hypothetical protein